MRWTEGKITKRAIELPNLRKSPEKSSGETRRDFIKMPLALAAGSGLYQEPMQDPLMSTTVRRQSELVRADIDVLGDADGQACPG
jgi:hypothetical protein